MVLDTQIRNVYGTRKPSRFIEYGGIDGPLMYCQIACLLPGSPPTLTPIAKLAWPKAVSPGRGFRPYWWQLIEAPRLPKNGLPSQPDTLLLVLGPDVELVDPKAPARGVVGDPVRVNFQIVRVGSRDAVPRRGEKLRPGMLEPVRTLVRAEYAPDADSPLGGAVGIQPTREDMQVEFAELEITGFPGTEIAGDHAYIVRKPGSCVVTHEAPAQQSWRVEVQHEPAHLSGSFAVEVIGLPRPKDSTFISHYRVRVVTCGNVTVRAYQAKPFNPGFTDDVRFPINVSHVTVEHAVQPDQSAMPFTGWEVADAYGFRRLDPYALSTRSQAVTVGLAASGLEMIPVLGSFIEIGGLLYAAATGRTWYGEEVTEGDLFLMGVFALLGVVPGVSSSALRKLHEAGGAIFPGVPLISMNPGLVQQARDVLTNGPRLLRDYAGEIDQKTVDEMLVVIDAAVKSGGRTELARAIGEVTVPVLLKSDLIDDIPDSHFLDHMPNIGIESLPGFDALDETEAARVMRALQFASDASDPLFLRDTLVNMGREGLWAEISESVRDAVVFRLFTSDFSTIRHPAIASEMFHQTLFGDFATYAAGKARRSKQSRAALEWINSVGGGTVPGQLMQAELGINWRAILRPYVDTRRFAVSADLAKRFAPYQSMGMGYREFREAIAGEGFGMLFQVDHILEQRFLKYMPEQFAHDTDDFLSFLVPWNGPVADNLTAQGVTGFLYVHSEKTALLRRLIPYGYEGMFTTQEYYYAYQQVYMKAFGFSGKSFEDSLLGLFRHMNDARLAARMPGETRLVADIISNDAALIAKIAAAHQRVGLQLAMP